MTSHERLDRLERRYERERRARLEAEAIADAGLRELLAVNESLDERIRERTAELEDAMQRASAANVAKDAFLAHIGHELRTPVNGLTGMLELLETEVDGAPATEWLTAARESGDQLLRLIERLLQFTDLQSADLAAHSREVAVQAIVEAAADRWRLACARAGQLLSVEPTTAHDATVWVTDAVDVALDELLDNVVTHSPPGSVRIVTRAVDDQIRLEVTDSGAGVPESATAIFELGQDPSTRTGTGAGIGLALAATVADSLGGSLGSGQTADGAAVWLSLPTEPVERQDSGAANR